MQSCRVTSTLWHVHRCRGGWGAHWARACFRAGARQKAGSPKDLMS